MTYSRYNHFHKFTDVCRLCLIVLLTTVFVQANCQTYIELNTKVNEISISNNCQYIVDTFNRLPPQVILNKTFINSKGNVPVFSIGTNRVWLKFTVHNKGINKPFYFDLRYTNLSKVTLYKVVKDSLSEIYKAGNALPVTKSKFLVPDYITALNQPINSAQTYLLSIESIHPIIVPAYICTDDTLSKKSFIQGVIISVYTGIFCAMLIYNLFIFFAIKDRSYLIYFIYTFSLLFAQLTSAGYMYKYLWPNCPFLNQYSVVWTSTLSVIAAVTFTINFLQVKNYTIKIYYLFIAIIALFLVGLLANLLNYSNFSYTVLNYNSVAAALTGFVVSIKIAKAGFRPAYVYFIAWVLLLISVIILDLRNVGILPYNNFTAYALYIGSAIETTLLSIALADKINIFRKEKEASQAESLRISKENEHLIQEQNIVLEQKITERTQALEQTLSNLKNAQMQLVESEKMASLGQLTAGIAHEINNPINFVKSNVKPLQLDVQDLFELIKRYQTLHTTPGGGELVMLNEIKLFEEKIDPAFIKDEIESLIDGIEEGAERTAEIVKSLRNFSRLDESEIKAADVHEGINSTLVLLKNMIPSYIKIVKRFAAEGEIECYPSKLNQVFMNILTNAVQAIKAKPQHDGENIVVATCNTEEFLQISIKDTGVGMTDEVKHKIFDPFFTTKDVGEGTGLGMSITFKIIEKHQGKISVFSSPGNGSEIILSVPYAQIPDPIITNEY